MLFNGEVNHFYQCQSVYEQSAFYYEFHCFFITFSFVLTFNSPKHFYSLILNTNSLDECINVCMIAEVTEQSLQHPAVCL